MIDDSLQQSLASKTFEKNWGAQIWAKIEPKIKFFVIFSSLVY